MGISNELFLKLTNEEESEYLDYKLKYHDNKANLIHDILCMSNSRYNGDKYIIFGINDRKELIGIMDLSLNQNNIVDLLRNANLNKSLYNDVTFDLFNRNNKTFAVLTIRNRPDKPFFLLKDCKDQGKCVRAGVIYTRNVDGNTPINKTVSDDEMELMWRQRFGLNNPPLERFHQYLENLNEWNVINTKGLETEYYNYHFPEFRVKTQFRDRIDSKVPINDRWLAPYWMRANCNITIIKYIITYYGFDLDEVTIWWCDNGKIPVPLPELHHASTGNHKDDSGFFSWSLSRNSLRYKVGNMIAKCGNDDLETILTKTKIKLLD